ncbi:MAG: hypothetical protein JST87_18665 [Bacteroidetes bacterium]|nr:hypothetical protein [Bacteroidota bacterium]
MKTSKTKIVFIVSIAFVISTYQNAEAQNTFPTSGNVGIGTTSPATILHITNSGYASILLGNNDPNSFLLTKESSDNSFNIWTGPYGSSTNRLKITNTGSVGISTTSPTTTLDVNGSFHTALNTQTIPANNGAGGLTVTWNRTSGGAEVNMWNVFNNAGTSFLFSQKTGASTYNDLMALLGNGNVGIGIINPLYKLDLQTANQYDGIHLRYNTTGWVHMAANSLAVGAWNSITQAGDAGLLFGGSAVGNGTFGFVIAPWANATTGMRLDQNGNVGIATANTQGYQLAVNGSAVFTKAVVKLYNTWPDYVFDPKYSLPSITELEEYIQKNKHLPEVPSSADIEKNGVDLGANQAQLFKKIEELTLYIITQNKEIENLKNQNKEFEGMKESFELLQKQINDLKKLINK